MRIITAKSMVWMAALLFAAPAMAQSLDQHRANCGSDDSNILALRIAGCTALIESGKWTGTSLAIVFNNRGISYEQLKDHARAISDYSQAIRINPQYAKAFFNRGGVYGTQKDYARAIADYSQVIRINPQDAKAFFGRSIVQSLLGKTAEAEADLAQARVIRRSVVP